MHLDEDLAFTAAYAAPESFETFARHLKQFPPCKLAWPTRLPRSGGGASGENAKLDMTSDGWRLR
jgi:hypothetical protein